MEHYEIDDVKWRVAEMLGNSFSLYSEDEIAELEAAFRTDDPEELQRIYAKWRPLRNSPEGRLTKSGAGNGDERACSRFVQPLLRPRFYPAAETQRGN